LTGKTVSKSMHWHLSIWRRVKGFLMPWRLYGSLEELKEAVVQAIKALGGVELKILGEGT
jgi:putative transposase